MQAYEKKVCELLKSKRFVISVIFTVILTYGFSTMNHVISIDDLMAEQYVGDGYEMLASGRIAIFLWSLLLGYGADVVSNNFFIEIISILLLVWFCINICILFEKIIGKNLSINAITVFTCVLISYPLVNEIWEYTGSCAHIYGNYVCASFVLLILYEKGQNNIKGKYLHIIVSIILMTMVCTGYESVIIVYIFLVFAILFLQCVFSPNKVNTSKGIIEEGKKYAYILVIGVLFRFILQSIIIHYMSLERVVNGASEISWGSMPIKTSLHMLVVNWIQRYFVRGIIYFPIAEFCVAFLFMFIIFVLVYKRFGKVSVIPCIGLFLSIFLLSIVQGLITPYRSCQVFGVFVAFASMLLVIIVSNLKSENRKIIEKIVLTFFCLICLLQAASMNSFVKLNCLRWEEEQFTLRSVAEELKSGYNIKEKPIVFVGNYEVSEYIQELSSVPEDSLRWKIYDRVYRGVNYILNCSEDNYGISRKIPETNVNSVIDWGIDCYEQKGMHQLMQYVGLEYVSPDNYMIDEAYDLVYNNELPVYPQNGYIVELDEFILVNIANLN